MLGAGGFGQYVLSAATYCQGPNEIRHNHEVKECRFIRHKAISQNWPYRIWTEAINNEMNKLTRIREALSSEEQTRLLQESYVVGGRLTWTKIWNWINDVFLVPYSSKELSVCVCVAFMLHQ